MGTYGTTSTYTATSDGGINGGGAVGYRGGSGGDATDIRIGADTLYYRVIVAGGGGRAYSYSSTYKANGGYGGGTTGGAGAYYSSSYTAFTGKGGTQTAGGAAGTWSSTNYNGNAGGFGTGGSTKYKYNNTSYYSNGAGGSGWYGGGGAGNYNGGAYTRAAGGGGGSGYVWTSSTASSVPSSYALSTSYQMTDAATIAGNDTLGNYKEPDGTTFAGHSGNGYARLTYSVSYPTLTGLIKKTIKVGTNYDLASDVTCVDNGTGCTLVKVNITDTSILEEGTYTVKYIIKDNNDINIQELLQFLIC